MEDRYIATINESEKLWSEEYDPKAKDENCFCHEQSFKWGFQEGVDWADKHPKRYSQEELCGIQLEMMRQRDKRFINKACKYLKSLTYQEFAGGPLVRVLDDDIINDFCKAMEE